MTEPELHLDALPPIGRGGPEKTEAVLRRNAHDDAMPSEELELFLREHAPVLIDTPPHSMDESHADMNARFLHGDGNT